jgi:hypothetical protein
VSGHSKAAPRAPVHAGPHAAQDGSQQRRKHVTVHAEGHRRRNHPRRAHARCAHGAIAALPFHHKFFPAHRLEHPIYLLGGQVDFPVGFAQKWKENKCKAAPKKAFESWAKYRSTCQHVLN